MRVVLGVQQARRADALRIWRDFATVVPLPIDVVDEPEADGGYRDCWELPPEAYANACLKPAGPTIPELALVCLSERFFALDEQSQRCVLLHEAVHVRHFRGRFQNNWLAWCTERSGYPVDDAVPFVVCRWYLAMKCLNFVQEVAADLYVVVNYPELREPYIRLRTNALYLADECDLETIPPSLRQHVLFYQLLRTDLGLRIVEDTAVQRSMMERRDRYAGVLDHDGLPAVRDTYRAVSVDTTDVDPQSYRELFDRVLTVGDTEGH